MKVILSFKGDAAADWRWHMAPFAQYWYHLDEIAAVLEDYS